MGSTERITDRIEREVRIAAPVERVWELVRETGWWIEDAAAESRRVEQHGDVVVVDLPPHGRIPVMAVEERPQEYAAFRWGDEATFPEVSTLVEFTVRAEGDATVVRVVESGFAAAFADVDERAENVEDNTSGWEQELVALRTRAERAAA